MEESLKADDVISYETLCFVNKSIAIFGLKCCELLHHIFLPN